MGLILDQKIWYIFFKIKISYSITYLHLTWIQSKPFRGIVQL